MKKGFRYPLIYDLDLWFAYKTICNFSYCVIIGKLFLCSNWQSSAETGLRNTVPYNKGPEFNILTVLWTSYKIFNRVVACVLFCFLLQKSHILIFHVDHFPALLDLHTGKLVIQVRNVWQPAQATWGPLSKRKHI